VRNERLNILGLLKESLRIPYQIGLEFHRNRLEVEGAALDVRPLNQGLRRHPGQAHDKLRQLRSHPSISVERESAARDPVPPAHLFGPYPGLLLSQN
jgi:hypothetical protein